MEKKGKKTIPVFMTGSRLMLVVLVIISMGIFSCKKDKSTPQPQTFVLVHGAWQASYVWDSVKAGLTKAGQHVIVVQLAGRGTDTTNPGTLSINSYRDQVISAVKGTTGKVILVGHSLSGFVISAVEEQIPDRIDKLVYLACFLPSSGQTLLSLATSDKQNSIDSFLFQPTPALLDVQRQYVTHIFCEDASDPVKAEVLAKFQPEPAPPFVDTVAITAANFGKADKYYIHTLQDHVIGMDLQNKMVQTAGITKMYSLNTSHSPFLSKPDSVTSILLNIAGTKQ